MSNPETALQLSSAPLPGEQNAPSLTFLLLAGLPLVVWAVREDGAGQMAALLVGCLLITAVRLIARGQRLQRAYVLTQGASRPAIPRKLLGSALLGLAITILAGHRFDSLLLPALFGLAGCALSIIAFGPDPIAPRGRRPAPKLRDHAMLSDLETALAMAEARIAVLRNPTLGHDITAFADHLVAVLHRTVGDNRDRLTPLQPTLKRIGETLESEVSRLEEGDLTALDQRRFALVLDTLRDALDARIAEIADRSARQGGMPQTDARPPNGQLEGFAA